MLFKCLDDHKIVTELRTSMFINEVFRAANGHVFHSGCHNVKPTHQNTK